jgi:death on curing protein
MTARRPLKWIDARALILLHAETLSVHGGLPGLRDISAFESALARPRHIHRYEPHADLAKLASAYGFGIVRSHPFTDGNKRAGFLAIGLFLAINELQFEADPVESIAVIMRVAEGKLSEEELTTWIRANVKRKTS